MREIERQAGKIAKRGCNISWKLSSRLLQGRGVSCSTEMVLSSGERAGLLQPHIIQLLAAAAPAEELGGDNL